MNTDWIRLNQLSELWTVGSSPFLLELWKNVSGKQNRSTCRQCQTWLPVHIYCIISQFPSLLICGCYVDVLASVLLLLLPL